jgi:uncharacterized protein YggE
MSDRRLVVLLLVVIALPPSAFAGEPSRARSGSRPPVIEASGEGIVNVPPDMATVSLGVVTQASTAREAAEDNARKMTEVVQALARLGVSGKDVRTQTLSLMPVTEARPNETPRIRGYRATNQVEATTRDLARVGPILDEVVKAGANLSGNVRFGLADPSAAQTAALRQATREAHARATAMADALGMRLTRVVEIRSADVAIPRGMAMEPMTMARTATSTPVESGELTIQARVILRAEFQ